MSLSDIDAMMTHDGRCSVEIRSHAGDKSCHPGAIIRSAQPNIPTSRVTFV